jgi:hypothetical protein
VVEFERSAEEQPLETRAFVSVEDDTSRSYTSISVAMADPALRAQVVEMAKRELRAWRERYSRYEELSQYFAAMEQAEKAAA